MKPFKTVRAWYLQGLRNLHFFEENWRYVLVWPVIGVSLAAILWGAPLSKLVSEKKDAHDRIVREAVRLSNVYAMQMSSSIEKMDELTLFMKYEWEASHGMLKFENLPARGLFKNTQFTSFVVIGPDGAAVTSTRPMPKGITFLDRAFFDYHSRFRDKTLQISTAAVGKISGKRAIFLTRRLENSDGSFAGVLSVGVTLDFFAPFADNTDFGKSGIFAVIGKDEVLRVSGIGGVMAAPSQFTLKKVPNFEGKEWSRRLVGKEWFTDGKARIVASAPLIDSPFRTLVALPEEENMQPFEEMRAAYFRAGWLGSVILLFFVAVAMQLSARLVIRKGEENELGLAYRIATDGGHEGFFIWQTVRDRNGVIRDFTVVDCNERGAEMYRMTKDELMGTRCSLLYPDVYGEQLIQVLCNAFEAGVSEGDFDPPPESRLHGKLFRRKMVRTRDGVAMTYRDISDLRQKEREMARLATEDALTGLPNRHWLNMKLSAMLAKADADCTKLALLFIDLDDFKSVNDSHGHAAGDELLKVAAVRLRSLLRPGDSVVRLGGDEFTIILDPVAGSDHAGQVAGRIVEAFKEPFDLSKSRSYVGTSIGICIYPQDANDAESLLKKADLAMYSAKGVKGSFCYYESCLHQRLHNRQETEHELQKALDADEFLVYYQPRVDTATGELVGFEALVRWQHPTKGVVPPSEFIPVAEASDIILKLGAVVMHKVCAQIEKWQKLGLQVVPVAVNVSAKQFNRSHVKCLVDQCLREYQLTPELLEVELTESAMMGDGEIILAELDEIKALGVKIHVDDFGTGYSSLAQLQRLNLNVLKVDRAFTSKLGIYREGDVFVRAIISMAHALGMSVVAEGVETEEQLRVLQGLDCDELQGFYISKPLPAADIPALMAKRWLFPAMQAECVT
jgi:diguanylate cyclase (GGDEF)-like protein